MSRRNSPPKVRLSGFTLIEVLIAVGAVSLIAIGLAKVFSSTGETVRAGRRLSNLNEYASLLERQIRDDVASMTREGFMVMSHRVATDNAGTPIDVLLAPDQGAAFGRPRRVDQLMFFASGRFSTLRDPIHPARTASGTAARVYYGHGLRNDPSGQVPLLDLHSADNTNQSSFGASGGPNEYASDWILLRQVTTLADPLATTQSPLPAGVTEPATGERPDNDIQVGLQPAAASIFRNLSLLGPAIIPTDAELVRDNDPNVLPQFSSGIIDLATTDLNEIRQVVLDAQQYNTGASIPPWNPAADDSVDIAGNLYAFQQDPAPGTFTNTPAAVTCNMKRWMLGALPAAWPNPFDLKTERRMRCELAPPNLLGVAAGGAPWPTDEPWHLSDQMMLAASNFVPHCTEFIVEWSFGKVDPDVGDDRYGQVIWHGIERVAEPVSMAGPANPDPLVVATPYDGMDVDERYGQRIALRNGQATLRVINPDLIHFPPPSTTNPLAGQPFYSCFGYLDPTFPGTAAESAHPYPQTIPWAWPTLLRITLSLVDPSEPLREQTFQFIIEMPEAQRDRF